MSEKLSINTLCYEAVQRKYRNAVVDYVRKRLSKAFPNECDKKIKQLFTEEEWRRILKDAQIRRDTGEISSPIKDNFDYLDVNHFYNIFETYFNVLFDTPETSPEQAKEEKAAILRWIKSVKNLRDPLSHPAEEDFSIMDAIIMIDCARRVVTKFDHNTAAEMTSIVNELIRRGLQIHHFSNEQQIIDWYTSFISQNKEQFTKAMKFAPVLAVMLVQAQAIRSGHLVSVEIYTTGGTTYTVPMAFTAFHTYVMTYSEPKGVTIFKVDANKGWGISDIKNWKQIYPPK